MAMKITYPNAPDDTESIHELNDVIGDEPIVDLSENQDDDGQIPTVNTFVNAIN